MRAQYRNILVVSHNTLDGQRMRQKRRIRCKTNSFGFQAFGYKYNESDAFHRTLCEKLFVKRIDESMNLLINHSF